MKKHGKDFLTKPRIHISTKHTEWVHKSRFQIAIDYKTWDFTLSILGFINGLLPILPGSPVLVADLEYNYIKRYYIKRKWW